MVWFRMDLIEFSDSFELKKKSWSKRNRNEKRSTYILYLIQEDSLEGMISFAILQVKLGVSGTFRLIF